MGSSSYVVSKGLVPISDFNVQVYTNDNSDTALPESQNFKWNKPQRYLAESPHTRRVELRQERGPKANQTI